jgi:uncharacterized membrane protein
MNETARIEAFSDGVFSIAATLLVLELKHPAMTSAFWPGLWTMWPGMVSFVLSFFFIGIMWINHHRLFVHIQKADDVLMAVNLLLLLGVVYIPYPTSLMGSSITMLDTHYSRDVAIFYNASYMVIAIFFNLLWIVCRKRKLLDPRLNPEVIRQVSRRYLCGPFIYAACLVISLWSVPVSLTVTALFAAYFLLPGHYRMFGTHGPTSAS